MLTVIVVNLQVCGKEEFLRGQLAESLSRLGTDYIDLYYMHRMDPSTPIEETMAVLKSLVEAGQLYAYSNNIYIVVV